MLDSQGHIVLPNEFIERYSIERGDKISYAYIDAYTYRLYCTDDRPNGVSKVVGAESTVDEKRRIIVPAVIRKMYPNPNCCIFTEEGENFYLKFLNFQSETKEG